MTKKFYFGTMRKIVSGFGTLFADIEIEKVHDDQSVTEVRVPLNYGPRHAWYAKMKEKLRDEAGAAKFVHSLPRISFEMNNFAFANDRKTPTLHNTLYREDKNAIKQRIYRQYAPIPYDYEFTVTIAVKNIEDGLRIMEQIIPMFRPDHTITIEELPQFDVKEDVTVNLNGITQTDAYEGSLTSTTRVITWDLNFTVHGHIFPPVTETALITDIKQKIVDGNSNKELETIHTKRTVKEDRTWTDEVKYLTPQQ